MIKLLLGLLFATLFVANAFAFVCPHGPNPPGPFKIETCSDDDSHHCPRGHSDGLLVAWEHALGKIPFFKWGDLAHKCDYDFNLVGIYQVDANGVFISGSLTNFDEFDWVVCKPSKNGHVVTVDIFGEFEDEDEDEEASDHDMDIFIEISAVHSKDVRFFEVFFELDDYQFCDGMSEDLVWAALFACEDADPHHRDDHHHKHDCPLDIDLIACSEVAQYTYIPPGCTTEVVADISVTFSDHNNGKSGFFLIFDTGSYPGTFVSLKFDARFQVPHHP
jgi:hypothetical protein